MDLSKILFLLNVYSNMEQEYFSPNEVARRLRIDDITVRRWIKLGMLEAETIRQGKRNRHRIKRATLEALETRSLEQALIDVS